MKKINNSYLSSLFRRSIQKGVEYVSEGHYLQFDFNTLSIKPFNSESENDFQLDPILEKILVLLRIREKRTLTS